MESDARADAQSDARADAGADRADGNRRRRTAGLLTGRSVGLLAAAVLVLSAAGALSAVIAGHVSPKPATLERPRSVHVTTSTGASSSQLPASDAAMMGLVRTADKVAPSFTLTDQHGSPVSLGNLDRHHVVVLGFMDDKCTDICPLVAEELTDAYHDLGTGASNVDFVSVNVNAAHNAPSTLLSFIRTSGNGIGGVPDFYYVTGTASALKTVWRNYGITVEVKGGKVVHSEGLFFIAPGGREKYEATPYANLRKNGTGWLPVPTIAQWGQGIAKFATKAAG